jgi:hypothetical protein
VTVDSVTGGTLTVGMVVVWVCVGAGSTDEGTVETSEDGGTSARGPGDDGTVVLVDAPGDDAVVSADVDTDGDADDGNPGVSDGDVVSDGGDELGLDGALVGDELGLDGVLVGDDVSDPLVVLDVLVCVAGTSGSTTGGAFGGTVAFGSRFSTLTDNCCNWSTSSCLRWASLTVATVVVTVLSFSCAACHWPWSMSCWTCASSAEANSTLTSRVGCPPNSVVRMP